MVSNSPKEHIAGCLRRLGKHLLYGLSTEDKWHICHHSQGHSGSNVSAADTPDGDTCMTRCYPRVKRNNRQERERLSVWSSGGGSWSVPAEQKARRRSDEAILHVRVKRQDQKKIENRALEANALYAWRSYLSRDASCIVPHPPLQKGHVSYQERTRSLFAEASPARDWGLVYCQSVGGSNLGAWHRQYSTILSELNS
ncbi:hypothetical protein VNO80_06684 [Phaseolus coccineus]|uniref:Uncharacterized protein n=1 Tax=Phaseolus coccineus TaxID=3886 RepID=A0AAN9NMN6_PHACN